MAMELHLIYLQLSLAQCILFDNHVRLTKENALNMLITYLDNLFNRNRLSLNFLAQLDDIFFFCELYLFKARNILLLCFCF